MKWLTIVALSALLASGAHAEVFGVKTVYVLPMAGGLDQYLALKLTSEGVLQVVTDPQKADAILTDGIGARLEERLTELYGAVPDNKSAKEDSADFVHAAMRPLSRNRGIVFLVNRLTRDVMWSTFEQTKSTQADELNHAAEKIVDRLAKAQKEAQKAK